MGGNPVGHSVGWSLVEDINDNNMMMEMMMPSQPMERMASAKQQTCLREGVWSSVGRSVVKQRCQQR